MGHRTVNVTAGNMMFALLYLADIIDLFAWAGNLDSCTVLSKRSVTQRSRNQVLCSKGFGGCECLLTSSV
jgi:hypothetical protein